MNENRIKEAQSKVKAAQDSLEQAQKELKGAMEDGPVTVRCSPVYSSCQEGCVFFFDTTIHGNAGQAQEVRDTIAKMNWGEPPFMHWETVCLRPMVGREMAVHWMGGEYDLLMWRLGRVKKA